MAKIMKVTAGAACLVALLSALLYSHYGYGVLLTLAVTFGTVGYHFCIRLFVGLIFNSVMKNRADYTKRWFRTGKIEMAVYKKLNVKKWKNILPTYNSSFFDASLHSPEEIAGAMCQAELVHETIILFSFLPTVASIWFGALPVFVVTSVIAACIDGLFVVIQRYNRPRVMELIRRRKKKQTHCR